MTTEADTTTTYPADWKQQALKQIDDVQSEQVLDDNAILGLPWLVIAVFSDGALEIIDRWATMPEATERVTDISNAYDELFIASLEQIGYQAAAPVTPLHAASAEPEPEADDDGEHTDDAGNPLLLDRSQYEREDLAIPKVDGNSIDRIQLTFSGNVMLDRSDPNDVALYNQLLLGQGTVTLKVMGVCSGTGANLATAKQGPQDVVVGRKNVLIKAIDVPAGTLAS